MKCNQLGLDLIKRYESCKLKAYKDPVGIWTIGWGHVGPEAFDGVYITQEEADQFFLKDIAFTEDQITKFLKVPATENQFSALVSIAYNIGPHNLKISTLLREFNKGNIKAASEEFGKWNKSKGQVLAGLVRRREEEKWLFLKA